MHKSLLSRRDVGRSLGLMGLGAATQRFGFQHALAEATPSGRRFIFAYVPGGWDQLLFLDPREHEFGAGSEAAYRKEVARTNIDTQYLYGGNKLKDTYVGGVGYFEAKVHKPKNAAAGFSFGPGVTKVREKDAAPNLVELAEGGVPMSIIRGINMGTLGHEPGYMYFLTGEPAVGTTARGVSIPIRLASEMGRTGGLAPVIAPVLALGIDSFTGDRSGTYGAFSLTSILDTGRLLRREESLFEHADVESALKAFSQRKSSKTATSTDDSKILRQLQESRARTAQILDSKISQKFEFLSASDAESQAVREQYGLGQGDRGTKAGAIAAFAAQTIKNGLSQFVSVKFVENFVDSHAGSNGNHLGGLYGAIEAIANLTADLSLSPAPAPLAGSWLDNTTIVVFSEFARTPLFDPLLGTGRGHHISNSCLLIGAGIQPGQVIGATTETGGDTTFGGMLPTVFDFENMKALPDNARTEGETRRYILPEDIGASLLASAGLNYAEYRSARPLWPILKAKPK